MVHGPAGISTSSRPVNAGRAAVGLRPARAGAGGRAAEIGQPLELRQLDRLQHRLGVLLLVAQDELGDHAVADAPALDHVERPLADLLKVIPGLGRPQEREVAAAGARRLERVIDVGQLLAQERLSAEAMHDPEVLEGGDVAEVPDQRAHQRRVDLLQLLVGERRHQLERPRACLPEVIDRLLGVADRDGCLEAVHPVIVTASNLTRTLSSVILRGAA